MSLWTTMPHDKVIKVNDGHSVVHIDVIWKCVVQGINIVCHTENKHDVDQKLQTYRQTEGQTPARYVFVIRSGDIEQ